MWLSHADNNMDKKIKMINLIIAYTKRYKKYDSNYKDLIKFNYYSQWQTLAIEYTLECLMRNYKYKITRLT